MGDIFSGIGNVLGGLPIVGDLFGGIEQNRREDAMWSDTRGMMDIARMLSLAGYNAGTNWLNQTQPMRDAFTTRMTDILRGNYNPASSPAYGPMKNAAEDVYGAGKRSLMETLPTGGTLNAGLTNLETSKAQTLSDALAKILTGELSTAYQTAGTSLDTGSKALVAGSAPLGAFTGSSGNMLNWLTNQSPQGPLESTKKLFLGDLNDPLGNNFPGLFNIK